MKVLLGKRVEPRVADAIGGHVLAEVERIQHDRQARGGDPAAQFLHLVALPLRPAVLKLVQQVGCVIEEAPVHEDHALRLSAARGSLG